MQGLQGGKDASDGAPAAALLAAVLALAASMGGCGTAIQTPLPEIKPVSSTSLSQEDRTKAVEELNKKRATHEQDAEQEIERSR
jgi:hypothetical protein